VQVAYDYEAGSSKPLEPDLRELLCAWQAARQKSSAISAETMPIIPPST
jgi:hypothetical protein